MSSLMMMSTALAMIHLTDIDGASGNRGNGKLKWKAEMES